MNKKIIILLLILCVTIIPLSVKAEMTAMTDNEMEDVVGQASLVDMGSFMLTMANKAGIDTNAIFKSLDPFLKPLMNSTISKKLMGIMTPLLEFDPCDAFKK